MSGSCPFSGIRESCQSSAFEDCGERMASKQQTATAIATVERRALEAQFIEALALVGH